MISRILFICTVLSLELKLHSCSDVLKPRGVPVSRQSFYDPQKDFSCLDGSGVLPFQFVNDDYCDCPDGSDEPGTAACPNGMFHCPNIGYHAKDLPSSRVNDGICDCCDSSDEYNSTAQCPNNCLELGQKARDEEKRQQELHQQGSLIRDGYVQEAKERRDADKSQLELIKNELAQIESVKSEKEAIKKEAEEREKDALDRHNAIVDAKRKEREDAEMLRAQEEERRLAESVFSELDLDKNNILTISEVQQFALFDKDSSGTVDEDEAKFFLHMKTDMDLEEFVTTGWVIMKPYYNKQQKTEENVPESQETPEVITSSPHDFDPEHVEDEYEDDSHQHPPESHDPIDSPEPDVREEDDETEDDEGAPYFPPPEPDFSTPKSTEGSSSPEDRVEYDEETKQLMEEAKKARNEFTEVESKFLDLNRKMREVEVNLETDFGKDDVFRSLQGHCFELTDREYVYRLCPFDRTSQKPKDGGSETSLGRWGKWTGPEGNRYSKMKFEGGATCWNGPARSVEVSVRCGLQNTLLSANEPSRCEYAFEFETPALCESTPGTEGEGDASAPRDEL